MAMVLEQLPKPAELDDDVFAGENLQNPYPFYEKLRDAGPVVKFKKWDSYALARHKELKQALTDWESFTSSAGVGLGNIKKGETWRSPSALVEVDFNFNSVGPQNERFWKSKERADKVMDRFLSVFERKNLIPGGFGEKLYQVEDEGQVGEGVANSVLRSILRGGMDTTMSAIGSCLKLFADNPDQWEIFKSDPTKWAVPAFEETIRLETPIQSYYRTTTKRMEFSGVTLDSDVKVQMIVASGNRDPRAWSNPEKFDITRKNYEQIAFGAGIHTCIGQMIARLETEAVLKVLGRKVKKLEAVGPAPHRTINTLRTLDRLPMRAILN